MTQIINGNSVSLVPILDLIRNSTNINMIGHEALGEQDSSRGCIEIFSRSSITIANMGRRGNGFKTTPPTISHDLWYFVKEQPGAGYFGITAQGWSGVDARAGICYLYKKHKTFISIS